MADIKNEPSIIGHSAIRTLLRDQVASGSIAHAYLFSGPAGIGKRIVALHFASQLLGVSAAQIAHHPDFFEINIAEQNSVEDMRGFLGLIAGKPVSGDRKAVVINNFEVASSAVANALLKTLEEPSPSTTIIVISSRGVMPTIASRSQKIVFNKLAQEEFNEFLLQNGLESDSRLLAVAAGSPGRLMELLTDTKAHTIFEKWNKSVSEIEKAPLADRLLLVQELGAEDVDTVREVLQQQLGRQQSELAYNPHLYAAIRKTLEALQLLQQNINKKIVLQRLFL